MFQKIIVCSDGSDDALFATRAGAAIAKRFGSAMQLLDVFNPLYLDTAGLGVWSLMTDQSSISETAQLQHQAIQAQAAPVFEAAAIPFTAIQELGHPIGTITEHAERAQSDLIVIGSRGLNELKSFVMGSVSSGVLHHAHCPVLVTHGEGMPPGTGWFQNILLASDGSQGAHSAALAARELAQKFGSALTVLNVSEKPQMLSEVADAYGELYPVEVTARVRAALLENVVSAARQEGTACTLRQEEGHAAEQILCVADTIDADLIVLGSRGLGGFQSLLLGSVSTRVAHHATCPVLIMR